MVTVKISIRGDVFELSAETPFSDVRALIDQFYQALGSAADQAKLAQITQQYKAQNDDLAAGVAKTTTDQ